MSTTVVMPPKNSALKKIHSLKNEKGRIAAIEPVSGQWFLADTTLEAIKKAKEVFPDSIFFIERVGYQAAGMLK